MHMNGLRILSSLLLVICLAHPAQAQDYTPPDMSDPLVLRLLCDSTPEHTIYGPGYSQASIFSLPEAGGGERLYVGFVRDLRNADSRQSFWRGPVATYWRGSGPCRSTNPCTPRQTPPATGWTS